MKLIPFDVTKYLGDEVAVAEYLNAALEEENLGTFLAALGDVAKAKGMTSVAEQAGLGRESLYKALAPGATPRFETIFKVAGAVGFRLQAVPHHAAP